jgi:hypothetical protein
MSTTVVKQFESIGARVKISEPNDRWQKAPDFTIGVLRDKEGEYFDIRTRKTVELLVLDAQKSDRHTLLLAKIPGERGQVTKERFLCGHDERHWFSATIPTAVTSVVQAKQSLKPRELVNLESQHGIKTKNSHKRHKKLKSGVKVLRQGEFFFIPDLNFKVSNADVLKNEPMRGGGSHFHHAQFLYRSGGRQVYVRGSQVLNPAEYDKLDAREKNNFRSMFADPTVHAKGKISHVEHATVFLGDIWHKVLVNTEPRSQGRGFSGRNVFLD